MSHCVSYLCVVLAETAHLAASRHAELRGLSLAASHRATKHSVETIGVRRCQAHGNHRTEHPLNDHVEFKSNAIFVTCILTLYRCVSNSHSRPTVEHQWKQSQSRWWRKVESGSHSHIILIGRAYLSLLSRVIKMGLEYPYNQDLTSRNSDGIRWTICAMGLIVQTQPWGGGATFTTCSRSFSSVANHIQRPASFPAGYLTSLAPLRASPMSQSGQRRVPGCENMLCEGHEIR